MELITETRKHRFIPGDDPLPELKKHLTAQQLYELAQGMEFVKGQTGFGRVTIMIKDGKPRFIHVEYAAELKP